MSTVKIVGLRKLSSEFRAVARQLPTVARAAGVDGANLIAQETRALAPRRTGRLAGTVKTESTSAGSQVTLNGLPYIRPIVFGWRKHHIRANPFPFTAATDRRDEVIARYQKAITGLIKRGITPGTGGD